MWDILRGILGVPPLRGYDGSTHSPGFLNRPSIWDDDSEDESSMEDNLRGMRQSPFSVFSTSVDDDFHRQMNQLMQAMFGITSAFTQRPPSNFDGSPSPQNESPSHIRDQFFKPGAKPVAPIKDSDLDGKIHHGDVEKFFGGSGSDLQVAEPPRTVQPQPRFYSRSVTTRTVRRADGTVETVRTERDHTGREETTVTTYEPEAGGSVRPIQPPPDDLLSKFFNF